MTDSSTATLEQILTTADALIREQIEAAGIDVHHLMVAFSDDGAAVIRSTIDPAELRQVAAILLKVADQTAQEKAAGATTAPVTERRRSQKWSGSIMIQPFFSAISAARSGDGISSNE